MGQEQSRLHRRRLLLFLLSALAIFGTMYVFYSAVDTLRTLDVIEAERDRWQRPSEVVGALDLHEGNTVADLGCGAGYFVLKLSPIVGRRGEVLAVDIRRLSLSFLWIRAAVRSPRNIHIIAGEQDDPHLPSGSLNALLIANAYHEFHDPHLMLVHAFKALRPGGRLVIIDRDPHSPVTKPPQEIAPGHEVSISAVEAELQRERFEIIGREDPFIDRAGDDLWWLLIARKPQ